MKTGTRVKPEEKGKPRRGTGPTKRTQEEREKDRERAEEMDDELDLDIGL